MGISIGMLGLGSFASCFVDLFKSHPLVDRIAFCDREVDRVKRWADDPFLAKKFNPKDCYYSLEELCESDVDAIVIMTQPWLHAPQAVQAMNAGKDVYSAVPIISIPDDDEILDWCGKIIETSLKTGKHYMLGETTCYRPQTQFCLRKVQEDAFGDFVYAEGEYCHDVDAACNLRRVSQSRANSKAGQEGIILRKKYYDRGLKGGPMHYPTHSTSGPCFVMDTYAVKVTCYGYKNKTNDPYFKTSAFSNEIALFKMANGATVRIAETREVAGKLSAVESEIFRIMGTRGTFSENVWYYNGRTNDTDAKVLPEQRLTDKDMFTPFPPEVELAFKQALNKNKSIEELKDTDFKPTGHGGSHPYLVHEFVSSVAERRQSAINPWIAARFMTMGVMAHKSALLDGETLNVPDWGLPPQ
jgi:predicted dehydrogenase